MIKAESENRERDFRKILFSRTEKIGEGTYGFVYKAKYRPTDEFVALKRIRLEGEEDGIPLTNLREICSLKELAHPNIVKLIDVILEKTSLEVYLIFELLYMDLKTYIDEQKEQDSRIERSLAMSYSYQLCQALDFCHTRRIIHRDLKPQNLLIDKNGIIKIADFGLVRSKIKFRRFQNWDGKRVRSVCQPGTHQPDRL
ncbi:unnamed protein product [Oikopleura dioica]|uniref:cyclin-dependent kinase n=1 Tax=Oikopleura dioica TaxID=34765 RepID=E4XCZ9_OIKDI|nr:unnamed protein product [Oikopleura dioica]